MDDKPISNLIQLGAASVQQTSERFLVARQRHFRGQEALSEGSPRERIWRQTRPTATRDSAAPTRGRRTYAWQRTSPAEAAAASPDGRVQRGRFAPHLRRSAPPREQRRRCDLPRRGRLTIAADCARPQRFRRVAQSPTGDAASKRPAPLLPPPFAPGALAPAR